MPEAIRYSYDPQTLCYAGETLARASPMEEGVLLEPAFSTAEPPPADIPIGYAAFRRGDAWEVLSTAPATPPQADPQASPDAMRGRAVQLAQAHLDAAAQALGYDGALSAATYADEPAVPRFQQEGRRIRRMRSLVWEECYAILGEVAAGAPWPDEGTFVGRLPTYDEMVVYEENEAGSG